MDWEQRKLGEIVKNYDALRKPIKSSDRKPGKYPYYGATGIIDFTDNYIFDGQYLLLAEDGANIIDRSYPITYLTKGKFWLNNHAHIMTSKDNSLLFLKASLDNKNYSKYNTGTAQPKLNAKIVAKIPVNLPSKTEQKKLGRLLSQINNIYYLQQRKLEQLKLLKKALLQNLFADDEYPNVRFKGFNDPWEQRKLGQQVNLITKGTTPKDKSGMGSVNFIKVEDLTSESIIPKTHIHSEEHNNYLKRSKLEKDDILFSIAGTLGRTAIVKQNILPANTNQALAIIRGYKYDKAFLLISLSGNAVKRYIHANPTVGAQPNLSLKQVGELLISAPSKKEQIEIGHFFEKLNHLITLHRHKLQQLKVMKKFLLQKLFI